ncbi:MAG: dihydrofolate reductase [Actinobacteria bacterium]|nr:MAG: dihydrofolate reductase [Actinomycetota bacterium]
MSDLIDTTEMYLRTIFELEEEGVLPMRARIRERLAQSGPTVSETVARMERDGLVMVVAGDHHLELTTAGREAATRVMRKHRIAECMLVEVIGMPWEDVHSEACRWEHVISDAVERRMLELLGNPTVSPYGNPIPGLQALRPEFDLTESVIGEVCPLSLIVSTELVQVTVRRFGETIQDDAETMTRLRRVGALPGALVQVRRSPGGVSIGSAGEYTELADEVAMFVLVDAAIFDG